MKLSHIVLHNFRKYEHARFNFHPQFTVLIGNNGTGKTTVLDAVAIMLNTWFQGSGIVTMGGAVAPEDATAHYVERNGQLFLNQPHKAELAATLVINQESVEWVREQGDRGGKAKKLVEMGRVQRQRVLDDENPELPLMLYYGAGRLWDKHAAVETSGPGSQLDAYRFCLDPKSDQKAFEKWFKTLAFSALQIGREIPAMAAVKQAVLGCIPDANDFRHDVQLDQIMIQMHSGVWLAFHDLSDGYRNVIAMVADIAHRASRLNPHFEVRAALQTRGICLIDEIDMHLHPKWQRHVVDDLKRAFPLMQFIVTTHSPFILQSLSPGEVIDLDHPLAADVVASLPAGIAAPGPAHAYANRTIEDIAEELMGVEVPQRSQRYQHMFETAKQYYTLLEQVGDGDAQQKAVLKSRLDELSAPFSDNVAYHAFLEMKRLACGLDRENS